MSNWERCVSDGHQRSSLIQEKHAVLFLKNLQTRRAKEKLKSTVTAERTCILDAYKPNKPKPQRESQPQRALHSLLISAVLSRGQKSLGFIYSADHRYACRAQGWVSKLQFFYFFCERNWKMALEAKSHSLFCSPASHSDNAEIKSSFLSYVKIEGEISGIRENINEFSGKEWEVAQNVHTVVALYLSPWVSSVRCDENTDVSAGQLGSDHTWIQKGSEGAFKHVIVIQTWNRCAGKVDFISLCKLLLAGKDRSKDQIWLGALRDVIEDKQQYGRANQSANQIISSPDAIIIPGADSLLTMFPEV